MLFGQDRDQMRRFFCDAWSKYRDEEPLEPLQRLIAETAAKHPEYHALMEDPEQALAQESTLESGQSNPFLHLSLHVALAEQVGADRPAGMRDLYPRIVARFGDVHQAEHQIMECLADLIWEAQQNARAPNEHAYLSCVRRLLGH